jgi:hypothetical protein
MRMETYKPINRATCERWISYQAVAVETFLVAVDTLLILRGASILFHVVPLTNEATSVRHMESQPQSSGCPRDACYSRGVFHGC